jgi:ABC-type spermidine/putrescine transport system permease subunit II
MLKRNKQANIEMITMGIVAAVMFAIAIPIIFNVVGSISTNSIDTSIRTGMGEVAGFKPAGNASKSLLTQVNSFFSIGPIYLVVVVAVGIIAAILVLRRVA